MSQEIIDVSIDEVLCDEADVQGYVDVLNGIAWDCHSNHGYSQGFRNTVAVDLTVASYMLGFDPLRVLEELQKAGIIKDSNDDFGESPEHRVSVVSDYCDRFDWDYMIDPDMYVALCAIMRISECPVVFRLISATE